MIRERLKEEFSVFVQPLVRLLVKLNIHPDVITLSGFILNLYAAYLFIEEGFLLAGITVLLAGLCDALDGQVAKVSGSTTKFGALLDSTVDRYSETIVWFGIGYYSILAHWWITSIAIFFALVGSLMVSYVRARAEGLGEECKVGFMQRPERVILIGLGAIIGKNGLMVAIWVIALLANYTVGERLWYIWKKSKKEIAST